MPATIFATLLFTFFSNSALAAEAKSFSCRGKIQSGFTLEIEIQEASALANVLTVQDDSAYTPPVGPVELNERIQLASGWIGYQGFSTQGQTLFFKFNKNTPESEPTFEAQLVVSPRYSAYELGIALVCSQRG